ncbi:MAG: glycosyltransferase [Proteobacteria bacterium]|nr:glycosyltransferase [Pseudomonadota bacterium]
MGIPIVCTDVGFMREIVIPEKTGYLVAVGDYKGFAEKVLAILNNDSLKRRMREEAQRLVHDKLSVYHMTASFEKLIAELYRMKSRQVGVNQ